VSRRAHFSKSTRPTKTVSAARPDTDANISVTLRGQHPGHQSCCTHTKRGRLIGRGLLPVLEPVEQLNFFSLFPLIDQGRQVSPTQASVPRPSPPCLIHNLASRSHPPKHPMFQCRPTRKGCTAARLHGCTATPEEEGGAQSGSNGHNGQEDLALLLNRKPGDI
jgi:hypothetical protein